MTESVEYTLRLVPRKGAPTVATARLRLIAPFYGLRCVEAERIPFGPIGEPATEYVLRLRPLGPTPICGLRRLLKTLVRKHNLRCIYAVMTRLNLP